MEDINKNMDWAEVAVRFYFLGLGAEEAIKEAKRIKNMEEVLKNE